MSGPNPRVILLATGGTLSTTTLPEGRTAPTLTARDLATSVGSIGTEIVARELVRTPSWALNTDQLSEIARAARDAAHEPGVDGVVLTHGTSTLEYSSFLVDLVIDGPTPVVLTGAMRRADSMSPDGPRNLRDALAVATAPQARGKGALVVFAGRVIAGDRAWKADRDAPDAFIDLATDLGAVRDEVVTIRDRPRRTRPFSGRLESRVALVKVVPGMDGRPIEIALDSDLRGLVIEALPGAGGVPPGMLPALRDAAARLPVVIASRAPFGRLADTPTGGTGEPLRELRLLSALGLTAEQSWVLLMATLADETHGEGVRRRFSAAARNVPSGSMAMEGVRG